MKLSTHVLVGVEGAAHAGEVRQVDHADARVQERALPLRWRAESPVRKVELDVLLGRVGCWGNLGQRGGAVSTDGAGMGACVRTHHIMHRTDLEPRVGTNALERLNPVFNKMQHRLPLRLLVLAGPLPREAGEAGEHVRLGAGAEPEDLVAGEGDAWVCLGFWGVVGVLNVRGVSWVWAGIVGLGVVVVFPASESTVQPHTIHITHATHTRDTRHAPRAASSVSTNRVCLVVRM